MTISTILQTTNDFPVGQNLDWLNDLRAKGKSEFNAQGLPSPKIEDWKYTNLLSLDNTEFRSAVKSDGNISFDVLPSIFKDGSPGARLVFVNGQPRMDLSTPDSLPYGVTLEPVSQTSERDPALLERFVGKIAINEKRPMLALNNAAMNSGFVLHVPKAVVIDNPIEVVFIGDARDATLACFPRNLIVIEEGAKAELVIHHVGVGTGAYFVNSINEVSLDPTSNLQIFNVQEDTLDATNLASTYVNVAKDAEYSNFNLSLGGLLSRHESYISLYEEGAECKLDGVYLMRGNEHCDNTLQIDHKVPNTNSTVLFKGVLDDKSRAVFQGKIVVHRDAQHTDGQMNNKTMLLSDNAEIDTKPELEIYADDVKCAHGAASGHVDEMALFYMRSRGIPDAMARNLLVQSFLGEVLERINVEQIRDGLADKVLSWMPGDDLQNMDLTKEWTKEWTGE
jgi:Fe-S cluster assembly protein SufD